jgi:hypothetical protein
MTDPIRSSTRFRVVRRHLPGTLLLALSWLLAPSLLPAQVAEAACPNPTEIVGTAAQPFAAVRYLADDALEGRRAGSAGERCAGDYIAEEFRRIGLRPLGENGTFFQDVPVVSAMNPHEPGGIGRNVIALLPGRDRRLRDEVIVIGAHYDHLGLGGMGSLAPDQQGAIHNGADDNASGVAAMLAAARDLRRNPPARSVVFIAFSGEELGLLGSARWVAEPTLPLERVRAMLNLDMVGRLENDPLIIYGVGTATEWEGILARANRGGIPLATRPDGYGPSDHTSFYMRDIPVLHFFTNTHEDYHRPSDEWHTVDIDGVRRIATLVEAVTREIGGRSATLSLVRGVGQPPQRGGAERGLGAYLGTIPDYAPADRGMRVGGVRAESPAEKAGLRAGDIILRIGDHEVGDIYSFTDALRAHRAGDTVPVLVLRDGSEVTLSATLGERP